MSADSRAARFSRRLDQFDQDAVPVDCGCRKATRRPLCSRGASRRARWGARRDEPEALRRGRCDGFHLQGQVVHTGAALVQECFAHRRRSPSMDSSSSITSVSPVGRKATLTFSDCDRSRSRPPPDPVPGPRTADSFPANFTAIPTWSILHDHLDCRTSRPGSGCCIGSGIRIHSPRAAISVRPRRADSRRRPTRSFQHAGHDLVPCSTRDKTGVGPFAAALRSPAARP